MDSLYELIKRKPYLVWYVGNKQDLSEESLVEHILNYGNWDDFLETEKTLGIAKLKVLFTKLKSKRRVNLHAQTINYFENYFRRYA